MFDPVEEMFGGAPRLPQRLALPKLHVFPVSPIDDVEVVHIEQRSWHIKTEPTGGHLFQVQHVVALAPILAEV